jgi:hypothetical protein
VAYDAALTFFVCQRWRTTTRAFVEPTGIGRLHGSLKPVFNTLKT